MPEQRVRKAHSKSRNGCLECKRRHQKCDECHPICGQCQRLQSSCSLTQPRSPSSAATGERTVNVEDLRLLHHWHNAQKKEDFLPFVDHETVADSSGVDVFELAFRHPYLLHTLLGLSALHLLHRKGGKDSTLYELATSHNLAATRLARPQLMRGDGEHRDAIFQFAAFSSLFAIAEPPLRCGTASLKSPVEVVRSLLQAFKMSRGILAVQTPFFDELTSSGSLKPDLWKDNRDDVIPSLEFDYPQLIALEGLVRDHCNAQQEKACRDALRELFTCVGVLATNHKNHSSLRVIMTWPMHLDSLCLEMFESRHPIGLVMLAHYAALMSMRSNYWFFNRWPRVLFDSLQAILEEGWEPHLAWSRKLINENLDCGVGTV